MKLLNRRAEQRIADAVIRDPEEHTVFDENGGVRSIQGADLTMPEARARRDLVADAPRAARAHLLEVPLARDARPDPRRLHAGGARGGVHRAAVRAAALRRARVHDGRRARGRPLADQGRHPRRLHRPREGRLPRDRHPALPGGRPGPRAAARRGRDRVVLSRARPAQLPLALREHAVAHPRARHARLPALARAARAGGVRGRPLRRPGRPSSTRRSTSATRRGPRSARSPRDRRGRRRADRARACGAQPPA